MSVRVGIIGVGIMGADHARTFVTHVPGATLAAIYDADGKRAKAIADETGAGSIAASPEALIADKNIDAVLIAAPDQLHAPLSLACLAARKPVLCEKPLAPTAQEGFEVLEAESKLGKRLVQIGYMRRYDPSYAEMKARWKSGLLGRPLMFHCKHRNVSAPDWFNSKMAIANSAVHEFDISRWMLDSEIIRAQVFQPETSDPAAIVKPVFVVLRTASGQLIDVEMFNNATYGYDVRGELVCEKGTISLCPPLTAEMNLALAQSTAFPEDWRPRFTDAYRLQNQAWIKAIEKGQPTTEGASAWDGYAAGVVAEAGLASLAEGRGVEVKLAERPKIYQ